MIRPDKKRPLPAADKGECRQTVIVGEMAVDDIYAFLCGLTIDGPDIVKPVPDGEIAVQLQAPSSRHAPPGDLFVMMRAGSDGTARALREVMAMGRPAIVSDRGMLPDLVEDNVDGFVVSDALALAERMEQVLADDTLRLRLGAAAKRKAVEKWDYAAQAGQLCAFYERLLTMGRR